jgi:hypothetical protein
MPPAGLVRSVQRSAMSPATSRCRGGTRQVNGRCRSMYLRFSEGPCSRTALQRLRREVFEGGGLSCEQLDDLRSCLYGLNTVLRLHFTQEEEHYFSLAP